MPPAAARAVDYFFKQCYISAVHRLKEHIMKKFLIPLFLLSAAFLSGCSDKQQAMEPKSPEQTAQEIQQEEVQEVQESISEETPDEMLSSEKNSENSSEASQQQ